MNNSTSHSTRVAGLVFLVLLVTPFSYADSDSRINSCKGYLSAKFWAILSPEAEESLEGLAVKVDFLARFSELAGRTLKVDNPASEHVLRGRETMETIVKIGETEIYVKYSVAPGRNHKISYVGEVKSKDKQWAVQLNQAEAEARSLRLGKQTRQVLSTSGLNARLVRELVERAPKSWPKSPHSPLHKVYSSTENGLPVMLSYFGRPLEPSDPWGSIDKIVGITLLGKLHLFRELDDLAKRLSLDSAVLNIKNSHIAKKLKIGPIQRLMATLIDGIVTEQEIASHFGSYTGELLEFARPINGEKDLYYIDVNLAGEKPASMVKYIFAKDSGDQVRLVETRYFHKAEENNSGAGN